VIITLSSGKKKIEFLKQCFDQSSFSTIRLLENGLLATPFVLFLFYKSAWLFTPIVFACSTLVVYMPIQIKTHVSIPTPFGKFPFEFTRGFRQYFLGYLALYFICYFAISEDNFNLALICLLGVFLINDIYYSPIEPNYYVWIYSHSPLQFLLHKFSVIALFSLLPALPIVIALFYLFTSSYLLILLAIIAGIGYTALFMLGKYKSFPFEVSVTDGFIIAASVVFPPFLLLSLPIFYLYAIKNLKLCLHD